MARRAAPRLLRDYVEHALYSRTTGYFAAKDVVGGLHSPLPYQSFRNEYDYRQAVSERYNAGTTGSAWLTPSEVFTPHYGEAIARSIVDRHRWTYPSSSEPLQLLEIGGGNGTLAADILGYLRRNEPELYSSMRYLLVEVSARYAEAQRRTLAASGHLAAPGEAAARVEVVNQCARSWAVERCGRGAQLEGPWWICMMEVLDNLPHDRIRISTNAHGSALEEAVVVELREADEVLRASHACEFRPLVDSELLAAAASLELTSVEGVRLAHDAVASTDGAGAGAGVALSMQRMMANVFGMHTDATAAQDAYVPTGSWRLLHALCAAVPEHQFTLADFSWLPPQPSGALNAPVVQMQRGGQTVDLRGDYLQGCGQADILFPTNFDHLATILAAASAASADASTAAASAASADASTAAASTAAAAHSSSSAARVHGPPPLAPVHASSAAFLRRWGDVSATACSASAFNPLLDDFTNTRILVTGQGTEGLVAE